MFIVIYDRRTNTTVYFQNAIGDLLEAIYRNRHGDLTNDINVWVYYGE